MSPNASCTPGESLWYVGLDLGQLSDYTAAALLEKLPKAPGAKAHSYVLRAMFRPNIGTGYPQIVKSVKELMTRPELPGARLVVDATGVGVAVVDMLKAAGLQPVKITITGGDSVGHLDGGRWRVPKRDLAGVLQALLSSRRLKFALADQQMTALLVRELQAFRVKVNIATGHDSYEALREGDHDDLVLALALACWYAERGNAPLAEVMTLHRNGFTTDAGDPNAEYAPTEDPRYRIDYDDTTSHGFARGGF